MSFFQCTWRLLVVKLPALPLLPQNVRQSDSTQRRLAKISRRQPVTGLVLKLRLRSLSRTDNAQSRCSPLPLPWSWRSWRHREQEKLRRMWATTETSSSTISLKSQRRWEKPKSLAPRNWRALAKRSWELASLSGALLMQRVQKTWLNPSQQVRSNAVEILFY